MNIVYTAAVLLTVCNGPVTTANCSCGHYPEYDWIGPYCSKWVDEAPAFCFLSGRKNARTCPGAFQIGNKVCILLIMMRYVQEVNITNLNIVNVHITQNMGKLDLTVQSGLIMFHHSVFYLVDKMPVLAQVLFK